MKHKLQVITSFFLSAAGYLLIFDTDLRSRFIAIGLLLAWIGILLLQQIQLLEKLGQKEK